MPFAVNAASAAAAGAIAGAAIVLGHRAVVDAPNVLICLATLALLWIRKIPEPIVILLAGAIGVAIKGWAGA